MFSYEVNAASDEQFRFGTIYRYWSILFFFTLIFGFIWMYRSEERTVYSQTHTLSPLDEAVAPTVIFTEPLILKARQNIQVIVRSPVDNSWAWVGGDFIHEASGRVQEFEVPIEYYHGVEGGESWSEGAKVNDVFLSAMDEGEYLLRLEFDWEQRSQPEIFTVTVIQDVPRLMYWGLALLGLSILPICLFIYESKMLESGE